MKSSTIGGKSGASIAAPKSSGIARDEWLKALDEAGVKEVRGDPSALTIAEFMEMFDIPRHTAARHLKQLERTNKAVRTTKLASGTDGRRLLQIAYRLIQ